MNTISVLAFAFAIGIIAGLRSMTAPAVVAVAARLKWLHLQQSFVSFMDSTVAVWLFVAGAVVELVVDKLPRTPSRKSPLGLIARLVLGGLSGAALCASGGQAVAVGAVLGGLGGVTGAFAGYAVRTRLVKALNVPDLVVALLEDAVAIGGGLFIVSRF